MISRVYKLKPTKWQEQHLSDCSSARRFVYNKCVEIGKNGGNTSRFSLQKMLTNLKQEYPWLRRFSTVALRSGFQNYITSPKRDRKFLSRKKDPTRFRLVSPPSTKLIGNVLTLPVVGNVKLFNKKSVPEGNIKVVSVNRDSVGDWTAGITFDVKFEQKTIDNPVGIDLGLKTFAVFSDGKTVENPRFYRKAQGRLRKAQKKVARCKQNSKRREKAKIRVARLHRRISRIRDRFLYDVTNEIVQNYNPICIEKLNLKGLARTKLAKSIYDAGFGKFVEMLKYKAERIGSTVIQVDQFYPSSKLCNKCGWKNKDLKLKDRVWFCPSCNSTLDRDFNASLNILQEGQRLVRVADDKTETLNEHRDGSSVDEVLTLVLPEG